MSTNGTRFNVFTVGESVYVDNRTYRTAVKESGIFEAGTDGGIDYPVIEFRTITQDGHRTVFDVIPHNYPRPLYLATATTLGVGSNPVTWCRVIVEDVPGYRSVVAVSLVADDPDITGPVAGGALADVIAGPLQAFMNLTTSATDTVAFICTESVTYPVAYSRYHPEYRTARFVPFLDTFWTLNTDGRRVRMNGEFRETIARTYCGLTGADFRDFHECYAYVSLADERQRRIYTTVDSDTMALQNTACDILYAVSDTAYTAVRNLFPDGEAVPSDNDFFRIGIDDDDESGRSVYVSYRPNNRPLPDGTVSSGFTTSGRVRIKLGRFIRKHHPALSDSDVELIVNTIAGRLLASRAEYELVTGYDILDAYHGDNYNKHASTAGTLALSCMRYEECQRYVSWYAENPDTVGCLVARDGDGLVIGRALIWFGDDGQPLVIDRPYGTDKTQAALQSYAKDTLGVRYDRFGYSGGFRMKHPENGYFPYMDTFQYFEPDTGRLWANAPDGLYWELTSTCGGYESGNDLECTECGDSINGDNAYYGDDGYPRCEPCHDSHYCTDCDEWRYEMSNRIGLCVDCHDARTCQECGTLHESRDDLAYHDEAGMALCTDCYGAFCTDCGTYASDMEEDDSGNPVCDQCRSTPDCVNCGASRNRHSVGDYCFRCQPRQLALFLGGDTGMFRTILGDSVYTYGYAGYRHGLRTYYPPVTDQTIYQYGPLETLPGVPATPTYVGFHLPRD